MIIGAIAENKDIEKRVSITPELVKKYISQEFKVLIEKDYGAHLGFNDEEYKNVGGEINSRGDILKKSDMIKFKNVVTDKTKFVILDEVEATDIDNELDFKFAEYLFRNKNNQSKYITYCPLKYGKT